MPIKYAEYVRTYVCMQSKQASREKRFCKVCKLYANSFEYRMLVAYVVRMTSA